MSDDPDGVMDWREAMTHLERGIKEAEAMTVGNVLSYLVTANQIGDAWGYKPTALNQIRQRNANFPDPIATFGITDVFWAPDVDEFLAAYKRAKPTKRAKPHAPDDL